MPAVGGSEEGASSKRLLPAGGVNQSPLLGSSWLLLNSLKLKSLGVSRLLLNKSAALDESHDAPPTVCGVLGLKILLDSETRVERSRPEDGGGGRIPF